MICNFCRGTGVRLSKDESGLLWQICVACQGRGEDPERVVEGVPTEDWVRAASLEELRAISVEVRLRAPANPQIAHPNRTIQRVMWKDRKQKFLQMRRQYILNHIEDRCAKEGP